MITTTVSTRSSVTSRQFGGSCRAWWGGGRSGGTGPQTGPRRTPRPTLKSNAGSPDAVRGASRRNQHAVVRDPRRCDLLRGHGGADRGRGPDEKGWKSRLPVACASADVPAQAAASTAHAASTTRLLAPFVGIWSNTQEGCKKREGRITATVAMDNKLRHHAPRRRLASRFTADGRGLTPVQVLIPWRL
jgi:hypothetical protein